MRTHCFDYYIICIFYTIFTTYFDDSIIVVSYYYTYTQGDRHGYNNTIYYITQLLLSNFARRKLQNFDVQWNVNKYEK